MIPPNNCLNNDKFAIVWLKNNIRACSDYKCSTCSTNRAPWEFSPRNLSGCQGREGELSGSRTQLTNTQMKWLFPWTIRRHKHFLTGVHNPLTPPPLETLKPNFGLHMIKIKFVKSFETTKDIFDKLDKIKEGNGKSFIFW